MSSVLLRCIARSVVKHFANFAASGVGEELLIDIWDTWQHQQDEARRRAEIEQLASASGSSARQLANEAVAAEASSLENEQRAVLVDYLAQTPAVIRRTLKRPADPSGRTLPPGASLRSSDDLKKMLAAKPARFKAGQRPIASVDLELVELLGVGGFGEVWKARNPEMDSAPAVALKFCTDEQAKMRLLGHEKRVINQVQRQGKHAGIVPLLRTYLSAEPPCLEYEYVEGGDLAGLIEEWHAQGQATPERVARLMLSLAEIVAFAHAQSPPVVHRDLKPANILVEASGVASAQASGGRKPPVDDLPTLRITDFGIGGLALLAEHNQGTKGTAALATVARGTYTHLYASPQQVAGRDPDPRDDVYALGVVWYQALTGQVNVGAPTGDGWKRKLTERGVSAAMLTLLAACVDHDADDRPRDAGDLARRLQILLKPPPVEVPQPIPASAPRLPAKSPGLEASAGKVILFVALLGLIGAGLAAWWLSRSDDGSPKRKRGNGAEQKGGPELARAFLPEGYDGPLPGETGWADDAPKEITNSVGMKFKLIPRGTFKMGSPEGEKERLNDEQQHTVEITKNFYMGVHEVTQKQYKAVMGNNPSHFKGDDLPVENVSYNDAITFCAALNKLEKEKQSGRFYRLPTEAEWEYACRGPVSSTNHSAPYHFGATLSTKQANFNNELKKASPVGSYSPNGYGLYDMHGNVGEWCLDWESSIHETGRPAKDPHGHHSGWSRVFRGGGWSDFAGYCRSAKRNSYEPSNRKETLGFRLAVVPAAK